METQASGAAEAIKEIERLAIEGSEPPALRLEVPDGAGSTLEVPILVKNGNAVDLTSEIRAAAELARELRRHEGAPPSWREGVAYHQSLASFIEHAKRFKSPASAIWANLSARILASVLDYHAEGAGSAAAWGRHRGVYNSPLSPAWHAWGGIKGLVLSQDDFAELLDTRDYDLSDGAFPTTDKEAPPPASLISLANNLEVYSTATAKRERDPNTGRVKIAYTEDKGVSGAVMPPPAFLILIPIFTDSDSTLLEVRLRVTVEDGAAKFHLRIHGAEERLREAFEEMAVRASTETGMPVFAGTPET